MRLLQSKQSVCVCVSSRDAFFLTFLKFSKYFSLFPLNNQLTYLQNILLPTGERFLIFLSGLSLLKS